MVLQYQPLVNIYVVKVIQVVSEVIVPSNISIIKISFSVCGASYPRHADLVVFIQLQDEISLISSYHLMMQSFI